MTSPVPPPESMTVFDRDLVRRRRDRAAADFPAHDFLFREVAERLAERLDDIARPLPTALELGCRTGGLADAIAGHAGIRTLVRCDLSEAMARRAAGRPPSPAHPGPPPATLTLVADSERLPFAEGTFDLVISNLDLHWVNDLPGVLIQVRRLLKPDGLLLASLFGGTTLTELRTTLSEAEIAEEGGLSPRISPFADIRDAGALLQRAGLQGPVVDCDTIPVSYADPLRLMHDLRGMGETNALRLRRRTPLRRATLFNAATRYREQFGDAGGRIPATFQVLYLTAWAPPGAPSGSGSDAGGI